MIISSIIGACDMPWRSRRDAARRRCAAAHRHQTAGSITMYKYMSAQAKRKLPLTPSALDINNWSKGKKNINQAIILLIARRQING